MNFADFMHQALYHPQYGYYHQYRKFISEQGDFITAPEISPIFSQCLANSILSSINQPLAEYSILELGAGNGTMAFDMLAHWQSKNTLPYRYQILETSDVLRKRQQKKLSNLPPSILQRIEWLDALPSKSKQRIIVANEVLDALPCNIGKIKRINQQWQWCEQQVTYTNGQLQWQQKEPSCLPEEIQESYCLDNRMMEIPQNLKLWLEALHTTVQNGVFFIIDYAEYDKVLQCTHTQGTIRCYQSHRVHHNPLINVGQQDITYHLNIDLLSTQLKEAGWILDTIETQAHFIFNNGLQELAINDELEKTQRWDLSRQIQQLTSPTEMGERYKVMRCMSK